MEILTRVFSAWQYSVLAIFIAWAVFTFAVFFANIQLLIILLREEGLVWSKKLEFVYGLYGTIATNFTVLSAITTVGISILIGMNVALLVFYIKRRQKTTPANTKTASAGFLGLVSAVFGIGCAACGSVILSGLLASFGAIGLLAFLPLHGAEVGVLAVLLLSYSLSQLTKRIADPLVCPV